MVTECNLERHDRVNESAEPSAPKPGPTPGPQPGPTPSPLSATRLRKSEKERRRTNEIQQHLCRSCGSRDRFLGPAAVIHKCLDAVVFVNVKITFPIARQ